MPEKRNNLKLSTYLTSIYKWRKFLIINLFLTLIIVTIISFLILEKYKSTTTIMVSTDNSSDLSGLSNLISGNPVISMGAQLLGAGGGSTDIIFGILNSRSTLTDVIKKFDLVKYYEIDDENIDKTLKAFKGDVDFETNENGINMVDISVTTTDPQFSAEIANYFVKLVDSLNIKLNNEQARSNRIFIEKRYIKNQDDLKIAEDSLYKFQKKYGIITVPEQFEVIYQAAAEIESNLVKSELSISLIKSQYGENSPQYEIAEKQLQTLREKVSELKTSDQLAKESNIFLPFKEFPQISISYLRYYREVELQSKIMEFILPMYEQAKIEEQKSMPTVVVIDPAVPAQLKDSPKRMFIILGVFSLFGIIFLVIIFQGDKAYNRTEFDNIIERKETSIYQKVIKLYKLKI
jgi:capsule polysaccharide export protein KpsE/RkpR